MHGLAMVHGVMPDLNFLSWFVTDAGLVQVNSELFLVQESMGYNLELLYDIDGPG